MEGDGSVSGAAVGGTGMDAGVAAGVCAGVGLGEFAALVRCGGDFDVRGTVDGECATAFEPGGERAAGGGAVAG